METTRVPGSRDYAVSLTKEGRSLLESHRDRDMGGSQTFYAGAKRERARLPARLGERSVVDHGAVRALRREPPHGLLVAGSP